jgi:YHS domain-containing protein
MLRFLLLSILLTFGVRMVSRLADEFMRGMRGDGGGTRNHVPQRGVQMARDPVCGTFVVPDHAVSIADGRQRIYFCSTACRDKYRARTA